MLIGWCGVFWSITCFELFQNSFWTLYLILKRKCIFNGLFLIERFWLCYSEMRLYFQTCLILVSRNEENPRLASTTSVQSIFSPLEILQLLPFALAEFAQLTSTKPMSWLTIPPPASLHTPACIVLCRQHPCCFRENALWVFLSARNQCGSEIHCLLVWEQDTFPTPSPHWVLLWWRSGDNCNWGQGCHVGRSECWREESFPCHAPLSAFLRAAPKSAFCNFSHGGKKVLWRC